MKRSGQSGFTIIELIIVIVIIALLATLTAVLYTGAQKQASDVRMRDASDKVGDAVRLWAANHDGAAPKGGYDGTGSNSIVNGECTLGSAGWAGIDIPTNGDGYSTLYKCTIADTLIASGYLTRDLFTSLPDNSLYPGKKGYQMMFYACSAIPNNYILYYSLDSPTAGDAANMTQIESKCGATPSKSSYNMRGANLLELK